MILFSQKKFGLWFYNDFRYNYKFFGFIFLIYCIYLVMAAGSVQFKNSLEVLISFSFNNFNEKFFFITLLISALSGGIYFNYILINKLGPTIESVLFWFIILLPISVFFSYFIFYLIVRLFN